MSVLAPDGRAAAAPVVVPLLRDAQVMLHDAAITTGERARGAARGGAAAAASSSADGFVVLLDLPLTVRPARMAADKFPVAYEADGGARVGLLPRGGGADAARWVDDRRARRARAHARREALSSCPRLFFSSSRSGGSTSSRASCCTP